MKTELIPPVTELSELGRVSHLAPELALRRAVPLLARLAKDTAFQEAYVLPVARKARAAENWHVAYRHEGRGGSYFLEVFSGRQQAGRGFTITPRGGPISAYGAP